MTLADDRKAELAEDRQRPLLATYDDDPYTWALEQADLLRAGRVDLIDAVDLAQEIEALAHCLADKLRADLSHILQHLLKWDLQGEMRTRSWVLSIQEHRKRVARHLEKDPGLRSILSETIEEAYGDGRRRALDETGLPRSAISKTCPYSWDEIMTRPIAWPETA